MRLLILFAYSAALFVPLTSLAEDDSESVIQYSIEFVCGANFDDHSSVVPGDYTMVASVHNAGPAANAARSKVSLSYPFQAMSDPLMTEFAPQQSRRLDCGDILNEFVFAQELDDEPLLAGFLLIQARRPLEVVARYTATGETGEISLDVENIAGRRQLLRDDTPDAEPVDICHIPPGNPSNAKEIAVEEEDVADHIAHGDNLGECGDAVIQPVGSSGVDADSARSRSIRPRRRGRR